MHDKNKYKTENIIWYDIHSHFLPNMDDGCKSCEESAELLTYAKLHGVDGMIATPHYYPQETISDFIRRRNQAEQKLREYLQTYDKPVPEWCVGAEVLYYEGLANSQDLSKLCLGNSKYLLLELPCEPWRNAVFRDIHYIGYIHNLIPIIAHVERYFDTEPKSSIKEILNSNSLIQINAGYVLKSTRNAKKIIRNEQIQILASDTHNLATRTPMLQEAGQKLIAEGMYEQVREIAETNKQIYQQAKKTE